MYKFSYKKFLLVLPMFLFGSFFILMGCYNRAKAGNDDEEFKTIIRFGSGNSGGNGEACPADPPPGGGNWDLCANHVQVKWNNPHTGFNLLSGQKFRFDGLMANFNQCGNSGNLFDLYFYWTQNEWPAGQSTKLPYPINTCVNADTSVGPFTSMHYLGKWEGNIVKSNSTIWETADFSIPAGICGQVKVGWYVWIDRPTYSCNNYVFGNMYRTINIDCPANNRPALTSLNAINTSCSESWSGKAGNGANNPVEIKAVFSDADGADDINRVWIGLAADEPDNAGSAYCGDWERGLANTFALNIDPIGGWYSPTLDGAPSTGCPWGSGRNLTETYSNSRFSVESISTSKEGNNLTVVLKIKFLDNFPNGDNYNFFGMARDKGDNKAEASDDTYSCALSGVNACWDEKSAWKIDLTPPTAQISGESIQSDDNPFRIDWSAQDSGGSKLKQVDRACGTSVSNYAACLCEGENCWQDRNGSNTWTGEVTYKNDPISGINQDSISGGGVDVNMGPSGEDGDIRLKAIATDSACNKSEVTSSPNFEFLRVPWMLTGLGDTYASGGFSNIKIYNLETQPFTDGDHIPVTADGNAFFSSFLISSGNSTFTSRDSFKNYKFQTYNDSNKILGASSTFDIYGYLKDLAEKNKDTCAYSSGSGVNWDNSVNFINGALTISNADSYKNVRDFTKANIIVSNSDITVADSVGTIDVLFAVNGKFTTQTAEDNPQFITSGSIFAKTVFFQRILSDNKDPAEVIYYDPKYLDLLRDCFGDYYPVSIREYQYSK